MKVVYYLSPSSFCFGVKRSIDQLNDIIQKHPGAKIFCIHALVHNPKVTKEFENKWVKFIENIDEVLDTNAIIIFSAHGTNRTTINKAKEKYQRVYNLECPFVSKIYLEIDSFLEKWVSKFVYIGKEHHQEWRNIIEDIRHKWWEVFICEKEKQIQNIPYDNNEKFGVLSQTTLNFAYVQNILKTIKKDFPEAYVPLSSDVCKATCDRQSVIINNLDKFETLVVIWWKESNNTKELAELWIKNSKQTFYGESLEDIIQYPESELFAHENVAITWWASTPAEDIREVFEFYKNHGYTPKIIQLTTND